MTDARALPIPDEHIRALRADFAAQAGRSLALPIAGAIVWTVVAVAGVLAPDRIAVLTLVFGSGTIFPIGLLLARVLRERLIDNDSPLASLMGMSVLMVNLLWAVHLTLFAVDIKIAPLSLAIGLGIHWIVFSWIIQHPLGLIHAILRTALVTGAWWTFPNDTIAAIAIAVVVAYVYAIHALLTRPIGTSAGALRHSTAT